MKKLQGILDTLKMEDLKKLLKKKKKKKKKKKEDSSSGEEDKQVERSVSKEKVLIHHLLIHLFIHISINGYKTNNEIAKQI